MAKTNQNTEDEKPKIPRKHIEIEDKGTPPNNLHTRLKRVCNAKRIKTYVGATKAIEVWLDNQEALIKLKEGRGD